ncbi:hypothetical protein D3C81_1441350 [compost metagenome]
MRNPSRSKNIIPALNPKRLIAKDHLQLSLQHVERFILIPMDMKGRTLIFLRCTMHHAKFSVGVFPANQYGIDVGKEQERILLVDIPLHHTCLATVTPHVLVTS